MAGLTEDAAARMTRVSLEGDGVSCRLFELLWKRDLLSDASLALRIPDTVIFKYNAPSSWYFTSVDGTIKRKNKAKLNREHILLEFTKRPSVSGIVAYFVCTEDLECPDGGPNTKTVMQYFNKDTLQQWLADHQKVKGDGILQRFVEPKSDHNNMVKAMWSPKVCLLERRVNHMRMSDTKYDMYERAVTFEGPDFHSELTPVRGNCLVSKVHVIADSVVQHVAAVTNERIHLSRLALHFKADHKDRLCLLFASSVRLQDGAGRDDSLGRSSRSENSSVPLPLEANTVLRVPDNVKRVKSTSHSNPLTLQKTKCCPTCDDKVEAGALCDVSYKVLIEYDDRQAASFKGQQCSLPWKQWPPSLKEMGGGSGSGGCRGGGGGGGGGGDAAAGCGVSYADGSYTTAAVTDVPAAVARLHPRLTPEEFARFRNDVAFLYRNALVCEACCVKFTAPQLGGGYGRPVATFINAGDSAAGGYPDNSVAADGVPTMCCTEPPPFGTQALDPERVKRRHRVTEKIVDERKAAEEGTPRKVPKLDRWQVQQQEFLRAKSCPKLPSWCPMQAGHMINPPAPVLSSFAGPPVPGGAPPLRFVCSAKQLDLGEVPLEPRKRPHRVPGLAKSSSNPYLKEVQSFVSKCSSRAGEVVPSTYADFLKGGRTLSSAPCAPASSSSVVAKRNASPDTVNQQQQQQQEEQHERQEQDVHEFDLNNSGPMPAHNNTMSTARFTGSVFDGTALSLVISEDDESGDDEVLAAIEMHTAQAAADTFWNNKWPKSCASDRSTDVGTRTPTTRPSSSQGTNRSRGSSHPTSTRAASIAGSSRLGSARSGASRMQSIDQLQMQHLRRPDRPTSSPCLGRRLPNSSRDQLDSLSREFSREFTRGLSRPTSASFSYSATPPTSSARLRRPASSPQFRSS